MSAVILAHSIAPLRNAIILAHARVHSFTTLRCEDVRAAVHTVVLTTVYFLARRAPLLLTTRGANCLPAFVILMAGAFDYSDGHVNPSSNDNK